MQTSVNKKMANRLLAYNQALFESMSSFVDAVWWIDMSCERVHIMFDKIVSELEGAVFALSDVRTLIRRNSTSTDGSMDEARFFQMSYLKKLKETNSFETSFTKNGEVHILLCNMTPGFDDNGEVSEVYVSMKDIQKQLDKEEEHKKALRKIDILTAMQKQFDAVIEIDLKDNMVRVLSDNLGYYKAYGIKETPINKAFDSIKFSVCSHSKKDFEKVTNTEMVKEQLKEKSSITAEIESITFGWIRVAIIPSKIDKNGEVERCIQLVRNIENIKSQERRAKKELDASLLKEKKEREILKAFGDIYENVHIFDLAKHSIEEICANQVVHEYMVNHCREGVQNILWGLSAQRFREECCEDVLQFAKLSDLSFRMKGKVIISIEALNVDDQWLRLSFIRVGNKDERLTKVILVSQNINEEKREMDHIRVMSHTDELTGLYNRHAYDEYTKNYEKEGLGDNLWYISLDINGLKTTNDSGGHAAGDEIIHATAECLKKAFGHFGKIFRMGGDEFIVTLRANQDEINEMLTVVTEESNNWRGKYVEGLSLSKGVVCSAELENCSIAQLEQESDRRMYVEKKEYHSWFDRRSE